VRVEIALGNDQVTLEHMAARQALQLPHAQLPLDRTAPSALVSGARPTEPAQALLARVRILDQILLLIRVVRTVLQAVLLVDERLLRTRPDTRYPVLIHSCHK